MRPTFIYIFLTYPSFPALLQPRHVLRGSFSTSCINHILLLLTPHAFMYEKRAFNELHSLRPSFCLSGIVWTHVSPEQTVLSKSPLLELNSYSLYSFLQSSGILKRDFFGGDCNSSAGFWGRIHIQMYLRIHAPSASDSSSLISGLFLIPHNNGCPSRFLTLGDLFHSGSFNVDSYLQTEF